MFLSPRWIIFLGMALVLCTIGANIIEAADPVSSSNVATVFTIMQQFEQARVTDLTGAVQLIIQVAPNVFGLLFKMLIWDYNFLNNFIGVIVKMLMWSISLSIMIWLALQFFKR
jgi:hypothetical protein